MKRDLFTLPIGFSDELIIDNFAGGGGTSTGLERAFGRPVDIAINHNAEALAMHAANHPHTLHLCESVFDVDPIKVTRNQPVGLVWLSPDCKHFSKAKGGKPVDKQIRGLAWVALRWVVRTKPRAFMLENVEEFKTWGPLMLAILAGVEVWMPDPARKGETFRAFCQMLTTGIPLAEREGNDAIREMREVLCDGPLALTEHEVDQLLGGMRYALEYDELRACDYGTPTIRKRFFMVGRRDGLPIVSRPPVTHFNPKGKPLVTGNLLPWRTAAECIDWSIPCPSIFERKRPLAEATMRRIAKGIMRYVVESADPFIVPLTHQGGVRTEDIRSPFNTVTGANRGEKAVVVPTLAPFITEHANASTQRVFGADEPLRTQCAQVKGGHFAVVAPTLIQTGYGEREGQAPRALDLQAPLGTVMGGGAKHALVAAFLAKHYTGVVGSGLDESMGTITSVDHHSLVTAALVGVGARAGQSRPRGIEEPIATVTAKYDTALVSATLVNTANSKTSGRGPNTWPIEEPVRTVTSSGGQALMTASLVHMGHGEGKDGTKRFSHGVREVDVPLNTVAASGMPAAIVTSNLVKLRGTSTAAAVDEPLHTISAGGEHHAEVRAFLLSYYGTDQDPQVDGPLATITTKDRFGLVTIKGQDYQIVDIGLRMLTPRELFLAQGFPADYIIGDDETQGLKLTKSAQVRMCGNSVCPPLAEALVRANFAHEAQIPGRLAA